MLMLPVCSTKHDSMLVRPKWNPLSLLLIELPTFFPLLLLLLHSRNKNIHATYSPLFLVFLAFQPDFTQDADLLHTPDLPRRRSVNEAEMCLKLKYHATSMLVIY